MAKLFPEFLNQGSKGPAVAVLQTLLFGMEYYVGSIDGIYEKDAFFFRKKEKGRTVKFYPLI